MLGRIKKWLGIEGVNMEILIPEEISVESNTIDGVIRFTTMNPQRVTYLRVVMIEKYIRGRRKNKLADEYELGEITLNRSFEVLPDQPFDIEFTLPFNLIKSSMDDIGGRNQVFNGVVKAAKWLKGVHSEYRLEAEGKVAGTALNPFDRKVFRFV